jgi:DNA-directed RNA polymerase subunit D
MKLSVLENAPNVFRFMLSDASFNSANAIRRIATNSVGSMAIDTVTFYENSTSIFDEYIAHRLGLVPILTPKGYGENDEVLFSMHADGPAIAYSKDLKSNEKDVKVANENIPIMKLADGQSLRIEAKAIMGTGTRSSKFQPGIVSYKANEKGDEFEFYVETFGQMPALEIITRTLGIISESLKEMYKELKK